MEIICERPAGMEFKDYRAYLKVQKKFIKHRQQRLHPEELKRITENGIRAQGRNAATI